jgi:hypothetical protein
VRGHCDAERPVCVIVLRRRFLVPTSANSLPVAPRYNQNSSGDALNRLHLGRCGRGRGRPGVTIPLQHLPGIPAEIWALLHIPQDSPDKILIVLRKALSGANHMQNPTGCNPTHVAANRRPVPSPISHNKNFCSFLVFSVCPRAQTHLITGHNHSSIYNRKRSVCASNPGPYQPDCPANRGNKIVRPANRPLLH